MRHQRRGLRHQSLDERHRPRRRGNQLTRPRTQPQRELQHVEGRVGIAPLRQFVAPRCVELRPAQTLRVFGREHLPDRAIAPFETPARGDPFRPLKARRDREQTGFARYHHFAAVMLGLRDQRDPPARRAAIRRNAQRLRPHPFRAEPRLAGAASTEHQPGRPRRTVVADVARALMRVREQREVMMKPRQRLRIEAAQERQRPVRPRQAHQCAAQVRVGTGRCRRCRCHDYPSARSPAREAA